MNHPRATGPSFGDEAPYIYKKGPAFGMPGVLVDGMDVRKARPCLCHQGSVVGVSRLARGLWDKGPASRTPGMLAIC